MPASARGAPAPVRGQKATGDLEGQILLSGGRQTGSLAGVILKVSQVAVGRVAGELLLVKPDFGDRPLHIGP